MIVDSILKMYRANRTSERKVMSGRRTTATHKAVLYSKHEDQHEMKSEKGKRG